MTSGTSTITTGVLLMMPEMAITTDSITSCARTGPRSASAAVPALNRLTTPVRWRAPLTTNSAPTVTGPGLLNTRSMSSTGSTPDISSAQAPSMAMTSGERRDRTKATNTTASTANTNIMSPSRLGADEVTRSLIRRSYARIVQSTQMWERHI